jgi:hypothetical protein
VIFFNSPRSPAQSRVETDGAPSREWILVSPDDERVGVEVVPGDGSVMNGDRLGVARNGDIASSGDLIG